MKMAAKLSHNEAEIVGIFLDDLERLVSPSGRGFGCGT
jgi:hypothetical protein